MLEWCFRNIFGYSRFELVKQVIRGLGRLNIKHLLMLRKIVGDPMDSDLTADTLNKHYAAISTDANYVSARRKHTVADTDDYVIEVDVFNMLDRLKPTATGLDALPAWFLKVSAPYSLLHSQLYSINQSLWVLCRSNGRRRSSPQYPKCPHQPAKVITAQYLSLRSCHV